MAAPDITGLVFGRLTVQKFSHVKRYPNGSSHAIWSCICQCGKETLVSAGNLKKGNSTSCGCLALEARTSHGMSKTRTYSSWEHMIQRGTNPNYERAEYYAGRGISVCDRWKSFENFFADMGEAPDGLTIERIDNELGYQPGNCRWADRTAQVFNQRARRTGASKIKGVSYSKRDNRWTASLTLYGEKLYRKTFNTIEEAAAARAQAEIDFLPLELRSDKIKEA